MTEILFYRGVQALELGVQKRHRLLGGGREMQVPRQGKLLRCLIQGKRCSCNAGDRGGGRKEWSSLPFLLTHHPVVWPLQS